MSEESEDLSEWEQVSDKKIISFSFGWILMFFLGGQFNIYVFYYYNVEIGLPVFSSTFGSVTITGVETDSDVFTAEVAADLPLTLNAGDYTYINVTFAPQGVEERWEANLTINCGDDVDPVVIELAGRTTDNDVSDNANAIPLNLPFHDLCPAKNQETTGSRRSGGSWY